MRSFMEKVLNMCKLIWKGLKWIWDKIVLIAFFIRDFAIWVKNWKDPRKGE